MSIPVEKFSTLPLFEGLSSREIAGLLRVAEYVESDAGDVVVRQGEPCDGMYVIASGAFEVIKRGRDGTECRLARLEDFTFFGEMSLITDDARSASVVCVEPARLKRIPKDAFRKLIHEEDLAALKVAWNMSRVLARRLARFEEDHLDQA